MKFSAFKNTIGKTFDWALPKTCILCNKPVSQDCPVCEYCYPNLPCERSACIKCGTPFSAELDYCGRCIDDPPVFDRCFCAFEYKYPIDQQIKRFKYAERPELARDIALLLAKEIKNHQLERPDLLIPVPMHISKLRNRGFNQALELTKYLSLLLKIPYKKSIIVKHLATTPQAQLALNQRKNNIKGCFSYKKTTTAKHVAIIDDVITTGSTMAEITKILKRNGVDYIQVWGVAHTK
ncbi:MAG: ComF family protein [Acidiferrobacterales bacterium]|nr:ComF family protein [Acidiferrobacterales bacterium]